MTAKRNRRAVSRRSVLAGVAGVGGLGLAGCLGEDPQNGEGGGVGGDENGTGDAEFSVAASFFMPFDVTRQIAGENVAVEDLVPVGEHGHDWDPDPGTVEGIENADAFVYTREFSSWQDDAADSLEDEETLVVDMAAGIEFIDSPAASNDEHFWMNPRSMQEGVPNVVEALSELDPDNAETYEENGEAFVDELEELHEEFEGLVERAGRSEVVVGSHDSYQWWWDEYDFEIHSPVGTSPDDEASAGDLERIEALIAEHEIEYILYDMYEPRTLADSLAEETGTEILPLSPIEGTTEEQLEDGWGYLEHQREINLDSLARALDAE